MASAIDATLPKDGAPAVKADLRTNLAAAKAEIETLQGQLGAIEGGSAALDVVWASAYGVGDGVADDTTALQSAVNALMARNQPISAKRIHGSMQNNAYAVLDLGGRAYRIRDSITVPSGALARIRNGAVIASSDFPTNKYMFNCTNNYHDFGFENVFFDANHRCGVIDGSGGPFRRLMVKWCQFIGFGHPTGTKAAIYTRGGSQSGVELTVYGNQFMEYTAYDEDGWPNMIPLEHYHGIALDLGTTDNEIHFNICTRTPRGFCIMRAGGDAISGGQAITNNHIYNTSPGPDPGIGIWTEFYSGVILNNFFDFSTITINVHSNGTGARCIVGDNTFYWPSNFSGNTPWAIRLRPLGSNYPLSGLIVQRNNFRAMGGHRKPIWVDTSVGSINEGALDNCILDDSNMYMGAGGATKQRIQHKAQQTFSNTSTITVNCSSWLFGHLRWVNATLETGSNVRLERITRNAANKTFTAHLSGSASGVLHYEVSGSSSQW